MKALVGAALASLLVAAIAHATPEASAPQSQTSKEQTTRKQLTKEELTRAMIDVSTMTGLMQSNSKFIVGPTGVPMHEESGLTCPHELEGLTLQIIGGLPPNNDQKFRYGTCWYYNKPDPAGGLKQIVLYVSPGDQKFDPESNRYLVGTAKALSEFTWGRLTEMGPAATVPIGEGQPSPQFARTYKTRRETELSGIWIGKVGEWHLQLRSLYSANDREKAELACAVVWRAAAQTILGTSARQ